ncbi:hypothetical protein FQA39_LY03515 [Lamprigera yunnana]|nr:hypothetical protein FQA39_LY03515 [Lamprigera yunnana]
MRSSSQEASHRLRVADPRTTAKADTQASNFEYDDNEWDIGIGNLIIDLDADIEKTNEDVGAGSAMATNASPASSTKTSAKMAIEHSATVDKGLKMKIKRTKPGTKTSEAKHEIVKSNEQNGNAEGAELKGVSKHPVTSSIPNSGLTSSSSSSGNSSGSNCSSSSSSCSSSSSSSSSSSGSSKRGSSGHRRDKIRDKHAVDKQTPKLLTGTTSVSVTEVNGVVRVSSSQTVPQRPLFPSNTGPGPPTLSSVIPTPGPPSSLATVTATNTATKVLPPAPPSISISEERSTSPPPTKKLKTDSKGLFISRLNRP